MLPRTQLMLAERALALLMARMSDLALARTPPAVLVRPAVGSLRILDFTHTAEGRAHGEPAALEQQAALERLRDWRGGAAGARKDEQRR